MTQPASNEKPRAIVIAGPNGAGKTTFAREFLPVEGHCPTFINADLIAAGLSPFQPDLMAVEASQLMLGTSLMPVSGRPGSLKELVHDSTTWQIP